jgi:hypothetical protein
LRRADIIDEDAASSGSRDGITLDATDART